MRSAAHPLSMRGRTMLSTHLSIQFRCARPLSCHASHASRCHKHWLRCVYTEASRKKKPCLLPYLNLFIWVTATAPHSHSAGRRCLSFPVLYSIFWSGLVSKPIWQFRILIFGLALCGPIFLGRIFSALISRVQSAWISGLGLSVLPESRLLVMSL